jgi:hypothetical protein
MGNVSSDPQPIGVKGVVRGILLVLLVMSGFPSLEAQIPPTQDDFPSVSVVLPANFPSETVADFLFFNWPLRRVRPTHEAAARIALLPDFLFSGRKTSPRDQNDYLRVGFRNEDTRASTEGRLRSRARV